MQKLIEAYLANRVAGMDSKAAARAAVKWADDNTPDQMEMLDMLAKKVTFQRRYYGNRAAFCWGYLGNDCLGDPYPATHYPSANLRVDIAFRLSAMPAAMVDALIAEMLGTVAA